MCTMLFDQFTPLLYSLSSPPSSSPLSLFKQNLVGFIMLSIYSIFDYVHRHSTFFFLPSLACWFPTLPNESPFYILAHYYCYHHHHHHHFRSGFHIWVKTWYLVFWVWLISFNIMISGSIHFPANDIISFFLWLNNTPLCICTTFYLSIHWLVGT
jgi:hypothetical protein